MLVYLTSLGTGKLMGLRVASTLVATTAENCLNSFIFSQHLGNLV